VLCCIGLCGGVAVVPVGEAGDHGSRRLCAVLMQLKACVDWQKLLEALPSFGGRCTYVTLLLLLLLLFVPLPVGHHLLGPRQAAAAEQCASVCHSASSNKGRSGGVV